MTTVHAETAPKSRYDISRDCVHCGLCLPVCPTYLHLGNEADSPRGRIYLMRAHDEGRQPLTPAFQEHLDLCLVCRACETACPSGVQFGSMMEEFRALLRAQPAGAKAGLRQRLLARLGGYALVHVLPERRRLRFLMGLVRLAQVSGLLTALGRTGLLRLLGAQQQVALAPQVPPGRDRGPWPVVLPAHGPRRARVLFLRGCVAPELLPEMQAASIAALRHNGCEVVTPAEQTCCGALHFHLGYEHEGRALLERNVRALGSSDVDALVVNAAGCGSTLKEYGALAKRADLAAAAAELASRVRDISEFLDALGLMPPSQPVRARVAYDDPCHLVHGQGVSAPPRRILAAIPGLELVPLAEADRCCGSAGVYNLMQPQLAGAILQEKIRHIAASGADTVATGNPGCILQIRQGLGRAADTRLRGVRVLHPMQLLAASYGETLQADP